MIKCVIFDFGDTLVRSLGGGNEYLNEYKKFLKKHKLNFSDVEILQAHSVAIHGWGKFHNKHRAPVRNYFEKVFLTALGAKFTPRVAKLMNEYYINCRLNKSVLMPNTLAMLKALKNKNVSLCVVTNSSDDSNRLIAKKNGIYKYFDEFLMSHEEGTIKSELKIFHLLLDKLNKNKKIKILPSECLMVGNNLNEDTAASQIGMKTVILTTKLAVNKNLQSFEPDYYIDDLSELGKIVEKENSLSPVVDCDLIYKNKEFYYGLTPNQIVVDALHHIRTGKVLDIGGGEGRDALFLAGKAFDVTLLDKSVEGLKKARRYAKNSNLKLKTKMIEIDNLKISGKYDLIVCNNVLQFLTPKNRTGLIQKMKAHTVKNGLNVVSAFTVKNPNKKFESLLKKNELKKLYAHWEIIKYDEYLCPFESHAGGPRHRHGMAQIIAKNLN